MPKENDQECIVCGVRIHNCDYRTKYCTPCLRQKKTEWLKQYFKRPDIKEKHKERMKLYSRRPEVRKRAIEHMKKYQQKPEVIARRRVYMREYQRNWRARKKAEKELEACCW